MSLFDGSIRPPLRSYSCGGFLFFGESRAACLWGCRAERARSASLAALAGSAGGTRAVMYTNVVITPVVLHSDLLFLPCSLLLSWLVRWTCGGSPLPTCALPAVALRGLSSQRDSADRADRFQGRGENWGTGVGARALDGLT